MPTTYVYQMTAKFSWGRNGWEEVYYYTPGVATTFQQALTEAARLAKARRDLLGEGPCLQAVAVEDISYTTTFVPATKPPGPSPSAIDYQLDGGCGLTYKSHPVDSPEDGSLTDLYTADAVNRESKILRGVPVTQILPWGGAPTLEQLNPPYVGKVNTFWGQLGILAPGAAVVNPGTYSMRVKVGRGVPGYQVQIISVQTVGGGDLHFQIVAPNDVSIGAGDQIHIHGMRGCWSKGLNGVATITAKAVAAGNMTLTLNKSQCCIADINYDGGATYEPIRFSFIAIVSAEGTRYAARKTGAAFFGSRGRRRSRCCKL